MLETVRTAITMGIDYVGNGRIIKQYSIADKELDAATKKEYRKQIYSRVRKLSQKMLKVACVEVEVKGKENLPAQGPVVYVVNHKSLYDAPVLASLIEDPLVFIGKKEIDKLPVISGWFRAMGCIYIERDDIRQSLQAILDGVRELKDGQSIVIFPEGTRSKQPEMGNFKAGSFKLATKANVPIVPIAIQGTYKVLEEKKRVTKAKVYVNVGNAIDTKTLSAEEKKLLPERVENYIKLLLEEITS
ncbi:MAG: lysophospholipid acyltransferase family protein [Cellulosilyticaceae bacterium]